MRAESPARISLERRPEAIQDVSFRWSPREIEVIQGMIEGLTDEEIPKRLGGISPKVVGMTRNRVNNKVDPTGVNTFQFNLARAIVDCVDRNLITTDFLTDRPSSPLIEQEVRMLALMLEGVNGRGISEKMRISLWAVDRYRDSLYRKLQVRSRWSAIAWAAVQIKQSEEQKRRL